MKADLGCITEKKLHFYFEKLHEEIPEEKMFVVHSYERKPENKRGDQGLVDECDFLVLHFRYGPLLFEVKGNKNNKMELNPNSGVTKKKGKHKCQFVKASEQIETRWVQLEQYLRSFFQDPKIKRAWELHLKVENLESVFDEIFSTKQQRSFVCFFNEPKNVNNNIVCECGKTGTVKNATILFQNNLSSFDKFKKWWCAASFLHLNYSVAVNEIMLNRYQLN